ncbi:MAG: hypothetical protein ACK553_15150 [Planctomycetota bacterium]|jgi:hypothetical protein
MDTFVPATQWDALRKLYPPRPSRRRGLRALSQAITSENPENSLGLESSVRWRISPSDCSPDADLAQFENDLVLERAIADLDTCFASEAFLDDLDWALQTYDIRQTGMGEEDNMDAELEMLEAVQDLTRFVARTAPRRSQPSAASPSIPD